MFSNILLAVDGSEASLAATRQGIDLAVALKARITVVTVTVPWTVHFASELAVVVQDAVVSKDEYDARQEANANCISHNVASDARSAGVLVKTVYRSHPEPYVAILNVAVTEGCDLIVVGCHQAAGPMGLLPGSETMKLIAHSKIPVMAVRSASQHQVCPSPMI